jgi:hypothetical protein
MQRKPKRERKRESSPSRAQTDGSIASKFFFKVSRERELIFSSFFFFLHGESTAGEKGEGGRSREAQRPEPFCFVKISQAR